MAPNMGVCMICIGLWFVILIVLMLFLKTAGRQYKAPHSTTRNQYLTSEQLQTLQNDVPGDNEDDVTYLF